MRRSLLLSLSVLLLSLAASGQKQRGDMSPAWSPDGTKIAFVSAAKGKMGVQILVMDADGSNVKQMTHNGNGADTPAWSPDGKKLAISVCTKPNVRTSVNQLGQLVVTMGGPPPEWEIYVIDADGSNLRRLTHDRGDAAQPAWSPDGKRIAFTYAQEGPYEIYVINADGSNRQKLIQGAMPAWSPDGTRIAFERWGGQGTDIFQIYTMDADGRGLRQLTIADMKAYRPTWSPDGKKIAFSASSAGSEQRNIYRMDADGANLQQLSRGEISAMSPAWSPDGSTIAFAGRGKAGQYIYLMAADGSNLRQLTGQKTGK